MADLDRWSVNESLLQSYRSIFMTSQSFLLAVGAIVSGKDLVVFLSLFVVGVLTIWGVWFPVVRARHRIVDYYKYAAGLDAAQRAALCTEKQYVHDAAVRRQTNAMFGIETNWRPTRIKMDLLMPVLFSFVWCVLLGHELVHWAAAPPTAPAAPQQQGPPRE
jgi:hypothetical protein